MLKTATFLSALLVLTSQAQAGPKCTEGPDSSWIPADKMQQQIVEQGYKIKKFKTTSGGCYEIYGWDQAQRKVEIYYHPVTGAVVKQKIED